MKPRLKFPQDSRSQRIPRRLCSAGRDARGPASTACMQSRRHSLGRGGTTSPVVLEPKKGGTATVPAALSLSLSCRGDEEPRCAQPAHRTLCHIGDNEGPAAAAALPLQPPPTLCLGGESLYKGERERERLHLAQARAPKSPHLLGCSLLVSALADVICKHPSVEKEPGSNSSNGK